jgi:PadR family transcriptional regulator, regulatory protein PadR
MHHIVSTHHVRPHIVTTPALSLLPGTVDVLILKTLSRAPMHGYGISQWIRQRSSGALAVEDAALYQALHRLHRKGWVEAEWTLSDTGRRAKVYSLTTHGAVQLEANVAALQRYVEALFQVLAPA